MITNIDDNLGRLFARLDELGLTNDTIVIFLTDNGPQQPRFNSGMRGRKGTVFEGGTRVPFFVRWPNGFQGDRDIDRIAAHIDIAPTVVQACGGAMPKDRTIDGKSVLPLWKGQKIDWPDRTLFFQWHRGDVPEMYRAFAARSQQHRLVQPMGVQEKSAFDKSKLMLFDIANDPFETKDLAGTHAEIVAAMKRQYEDWFRDVEGTRKFAPPRIVVGSEKENPTVLTRQDWRSKDGNWTPKSLGYWELQVANGGTFEFTAILSAAAAKGALLHLDLNGDKYTKKIDEGDKSAFLRGIDLGAGSLRLEAWIEEGGTVRGTRLVEVRRQ
jgi:hypothetical protein